VIDVQHERLLVCRVCDQTVIVGAYIADLDPRLFTCLGCRPLVQNPAEAGELADRITVARAAQAAQVAKHDGIPF